VRARLAFLAPARPDARSLDVGGTSTDVSRFDGRYEIVYETTTAGVTIQSPQLDINTVAAGGGSCLAWRNGLFNAGPESAGAEPGPACYRCVAAYSPPHRWWHADA
jgi:N-methylhydantoinase A/oxoprolinase/acetone carboxylase beta subunit